MYPSGDFDSRRFHPNIMITVDEDLSGHEEEGWIGKELDLGMQFRLRV
jgi:hypothetical protein